MPCALRFVGSTIGVAVLGTILNSRYRGRLHITSLPASITHAARAGVTAGVAAAHKLSSAPLLDAVRAAFVDAMDVMLWVTAGIALTAALLALAFLCALRPSTETARPLERDESQDRAVAT